MTPYFTVPDFDWSTMIPRSVVSDTSMYSTSPECTFYGGFLPLVYHSLAGAYSGASSLNSSSNMSTGVVNPTNEGLASEQAINMISGNVGNPQATHHVVIIRLGGNHSILHLEDNLLVDLTLQLGGNSLPETTLTRLKCLKLVLVNMLCLNPPLECLTMD